MYLVKDTSGRRNNTVVSAYIEFDEKGFREVPGVEVAETKKGTAYASFLRGLLNQGL